MLDDKMLIAGSKRLDVMRLKVSDKIITPYAINLLLLLNSNNIYEKFYILCL